MPFDVLLTSSMAEAWAVAPEVFTDKLWACISCCTNIAEVEKKRGMIFFRTEIFILKWLNGCALTGLVNVY